MDEGKTRNEIADDAMQSGDLFLARTGDPADWAAVATARAEEDYRLGERIRDGFKMLGGGG